MSIEYLGLSSINGPLIALEGVQDAFFDEKYMKIKPLFRYLKALKICP